MKAISVIVALVSSLSVGCYNMSSNLVLPVDWRYERIGLDEFRVFVPASEKNADQQAFPVAADIVRKHGYKSFEVVTPDKEFPHSGTFFEWGDDYRGNPGVMTWRIGSSFLVRAHKEEPERGRKLLDANLLSQYKKRQESVEKQ